MPVSETTVLREVVQRAPVPLVLVWGDDLEIRLVNELAAELLPGGDALLGQTFEAALPEALDLAREIRSALLAQGEAVRVPDVALPAGGGAERWFTFDLVPVDAGEGRGMLIAARETTGEVRARMDLERDLASEHRIAAELQTSLMPSSLPVVPGIDAASGFRFAGHGREIGGDFYDVFPVRDDCWMVTIGDVCGKGAEAATVGALAHYTLRAAALRDRSEPCALLARLNQALLHQVGDGRFVSVVCAFLEPLESGGATLRVCSAGHVPPLRVGADGAVQEVGGRHGTVLGVWDHVELSEERVELAPGERLVLYTDGVLDADPDAELTERGFAQLVGREGAAGSAADTVAAIERAVLARAGAPARDDIALLVMRPDGSGPAADHR